jgi:hypothetical protein
MFKKDGQYPLLALGPVDSEFDTFELKETGYTYALVRGHVESIDVIKGRGYKLS